MKTSIHHLFAALFVTCTFSFGVYSTLAAATVTRITAGTGNSMFVKSDGSLWVMGYNFEGELGENPGRTYLVPVQIVPSGVSSCALGWYHSLFLKTDGSLWTMGRGYYGQLGDGKTQSRSIPQSIIASGVTRIAAGSFHSLFKTSTGGKDTRAVTLQGMGFNGSGQLGDGTTTQRESPVQIRFAQTIVDRSGKVTLNDIIAFAGGDRHSLFIQGPNGGLWAMGDNSFGQLGDGTTMYRSTPVRVASDAVAVAAGSNRSFFVKSDGSLWAMGNGSFKGADVPAQIVASDVVAVAAGYAHSLFIKSDGSLWAMGDNRSGQLGDGSLTTRPTPVQIVAANVTAVAAGSSHSLFVKTDGSLWAMGDNNSGQLGDGTTTSRSNPVQIDPPPPPPRPIQPSFGGIRLDGSSLVLNALGQPSRTYITVTAQDLNLPTAQWRPISTNQSNLGGEFTITMPKPIDPSPRPQYFLLRSVANN